MYQAIKHSTLLRWRGLRMAALPSIVFSHTAARRHIRASAVDGKRLYILDMMPLAYRCAAVMADKQPQDMQTPGQLHSSAADEWRSSVQKFMDRLLHLLLHQTPPPTHMAVVVDAPGATFRQQKFPRYKAHRPDAAPDFQQKVSRMLAFVDALGIPILTVPGVEADDVCGSLAVRAVKDGFEVVLVSPDKDFTQLLQPSVSILRSIGQPDLYTHETFAEETGLPASQARLWVDVKALAGDPSDNIPGVRDIGMKSALQLVKAFGTVEELLGAVNDQQRLEEAAVKLNRRQLEMLRSADGMLAARFAKELVTIVTNLQAPPVRQSWDMYELKHPIDDGQKAIQYAEDMQLRWVVGRLQHLLKEWKQVHKQQ